MPLVRYVAADGQVTELDVAEGTSIMQAALMRSLAGITADCGGACQCATCHVYVDDAWADKLPPMGDTEDAMLDGTTESRQASSRLSCQLIMTAEMDGITVHLPASQ